MDGKWLNEPLQWFESHGRLAFTTAPESDFWNNTHYGFRHTSGHFFGQKTGGDFSAEAVFSANMRRSTIRPG